MAQFLTDSANNVSEPPVTRSSWPLTLLKVGLSAVAIGGVAMAVDLGAVWHRLLHQNLWLLSAAGAIIVVQIVVGGLRWHLILLDLGAPARAATSVRVFYMSVFFNTWLWGTVGGDVIRAWLSHRAKFGLSAAINSVILDRVAAVAGVAILVLVTAPVFVQHTGQAALAILFGGLSACGLAGIIVVGHIHRFPVNWQRYRLLRGLHVLSNATRVIFLYPITALRILGLAVVAQTVGGVATYVMSVGLNIDLHLVDCIILMQPVALITALPISVGGWGVRETAMIGALSLVGIPSSAALSLSVQIGLLMILISLPGAAFWLWHKDTDR
jgi:hypothetical protein